MKRLDEIKQDQSKNENSELRTRTPTQRKNNKLTGSPYPKREVF